MVVDDEATITTHLEERLGHMGYKVVGRSSSGESAVEMARRLKPDLILMDIVMPGKLDGIEASQVIREELDIPVVFLTAYGDDQFIKRAKTVEPLGYIVKPFQDNALKAAIEIALYNNDVRRRLRDSEELWHSLVKEIQEGIILADQASNIFFWNRGAENIFKYSAKEATGKPLAFLLPEAIRESYQKEINQLITSGRSSLAGKRIESVGLRKDWSKFPLEFYLTSWKLKDQLFLICIVRDITDLKRTEDGIKASLKEKEMLLDELQTQVKNNLEVIYNLLKLQFDYLENRKALAASKKSADYAKFVALMKEKLYQTKPIGRIDFANYMRNMASRLFGAYGISPKDIKLKINIEEIILDIQTATACGLIASELLSNAVKYAFPEEKRGEVDIDFHRDKENRYAMVIKDNGVGFPKDLNFRRPGSIGLQIVNDLVSQLKGTLQLDRRGGTKFKLTFPTD